MRKRAHRKSTNSAPGGIDDPNPLRALMLRLPQLHTSANGTLQLHRSPAKLIGEVTASAHATSRALDAGLQALADICADASEPGRDGISADAVIALEQLASMLAECSDNQLILSAECFRARRPRAFSRCDDAQV